MHHSTITYEFITSFVFHQINVPFYSCLTSIIDWPNWFLNSLKLGFKKATEATSARTIFGRVYFFNELIDDLVKKEPERCGHYSPADCGILQRRCIFITYHVTQDTNAQIKTDLQGRDRYASPAVRSVNDYEVVVFCLIEDRSLASTISFLAAIVHDVKWFFNK